jgi:hypothetical protein
MQVARTSGEDAILGFKGLIFHDTYCNSDSLFGILRFYFLLQALVLVKMEGQ